MKLTEAHTNIFTFQMVIIEVKLGHGLFLKEELKLDPQNILLRSNLYSDMILLRRLKKDSKLYFKWINNKRLVEYNSIFKPIL